MNRIKRYTDQVFAENRAAFGLDFAENKKALEKIATIRSKELKNEVAGFITRTLRKEKRGAEERRMRAEADSAQARASIDEKPADTMDNVEFEGATLEDDSVGAKAAD